MAYILAVGVATLDVVLTTDGYPEENSKRRAQARRITRGGNAANTLTVLARLGHECAWAGTLAADDAAAFIRRDLERLGVALTAARVHERGATPTSYVIHNRRNGSRTIVHYRDLAEFAAADFCTIDLSSCDWCHFEGRNPAETQAMLAHARRPGLSLSLEVEQARPGIENLFSLADVLLFSRDYALAQGAGDGAALLNNLAPALPGRRLFCTWGEEGAWAMDENGNCHHQPASPVPEVVDTLGAGDTFNAGVIDGCLRGYTVARTLRHACHLAALKCAHHGLEFPLEPYDRHL